MHILYPPIPYLWDYTAYVVIAFCAFTVYLYLLFNTQKDSSLEHSTYSHEWCLHLTLALPDFSFYQFMLLPRNFHCGSYGSEFGMTGGQLPDDCLSSLVWEGELNEPNIEDLVQ